MNQRNEELVPHNGNYKRLLSYQKANTIYCLTCYFVKRYMHWSDRTCDQMIQAARRENSDHHPPMAARTASSGWNTSSTLTSPSSSISAWVTAASSTSTASPTTRSTGD